jgi:hypothetical protein
VVRRHRRESAFVNRDTQLSMVRTQAALLGLDPGHFALFEILGLGGIGKSRLLREVRREIVADGGRIHLAWVSLDADAGTTETTALEVLRAQMPGDRLLFDAALARYRQATGQPPPSRSPGMASRSGDLALSQVGMPLKIDFAAELFRRSRKAVKRTLRYDSEEFAEIDEMRDQPGELRQRLPGYLATDLRRDPREPRIAIFYDAYEKQPESVLDQGAPWLRTFLLELDRGLHVVTSRTPLPWDGTDLDRSRQVLHLGELPIDDARRFVFNRLGEIDPVLEDRLLAATRRIPFFLEATVEVCEGQIDADGAIDLDQIPIDPEGAVARFLDHLPNEDRALAIAASAVRVFDRGIFGALLATLGRSPSELAFEDFTDSFFVLALGDGFFATHDLLTDHVLALRPKRDRRIIEAALVAATAHVEQRAMSGEDLSAVLRLYQALLDGWATLDVPDRSVAQLVDVGYCLYDAGRWQDLASLEVKNPRRGRDGGSAVVVSFIRALAARRTAGTSVALRLLEELEPRASTLADRARAFEMEVAYLTEISGDYSSARERFRVLAARTDPMDPTDRTDIRIRLHHADILTMDGQLLDASRLLLETSELVSPAGGVEWTELVRQRAHAFRFSCLWTEAEALYRQALSVVGDVPGPAAKLQTNLAESTCWVDAERALEDADLAEALNLRLGSRIELAKCEAARSIALARLGRSAEARRAVERAQAHADASGYPAGAAFAFQALAVTEGLAHDTPSHRAAFSALGAIARELGTYRHLLVAPAWLADGGSFEAAARPVEWIRPEEVSSRLEVSLGARP